MALSKDPEKRARQLANLKTMVFEKGNKYGKGRPRSTIRTMVEQFEAEGMVMPTPLEISKIYVYVATRTEEELKAILGNKELPMMTRIIAKGVLDKKGLDVLEKIIDRAYGKEQRVDITTNGKDVVVEPLQIRFVADKEALARAQGEVQPISESQSESNE